MEFKSVRRRGTSLRAYNSATLNRGAASVQLAVGVEGRYPSLSSGIHLAPCWATPEVIAVCFRSSIK